MKINRLLSYVVAVILLLSLSQCSPYKKLVLFQGAEEANGSEVTMSMADYKLKPFDNLYIKVFTQDNVINSYYNQSLGGGQSGLVSTELGMHVNSHTINDSGYVNLPAIGNVKVSDHTLEEVKELINQSLKNYLTDATIEVKLVNYKVTILGEVSNSGIVIINDNQISLLSLIAEARYFTQFGDRQNIKLLRETPSGTMIYNIDLTEGAIVDSELMNLLPNDIVYVPPLKAKIWGSNRVPLSEIVTIISTTILIINFVGTR